MRKFLLAAVAFFFCVSLTIAAEVVFMSYDKDKKELTVKEDDKEKTYKVTDKTTFKMGDKDLASDKGVGALEKLAENEKAKGKRKMEITADGSDLKEIKFPARKKKADK